MYGQAMIHDDLKRVRLLNTGGKLRCLLSRLPAPAFSFDATPSGFVFDDLIVSTFYRKSWAYGHLVKPREPESSFVTLAGTHHYIYRLTQSIWTSVGPASSASHWDVHRIIFRNSTHEVVFLHGQQSQTLRQICPEQNKKPKIQTQL